MGQQAENPGHPAILAFVAERPWQARDGSALPAGRQVVEQPGQFRVAAAEQGGEGRSVFRQGHAAGGDDFIARGEQFDGPGRRKPLRLEGDIAGGGQHRDQGGGIGFEKIDLFGNRVERGELFLGLPGALEARQQTRRRLGRTGGRTASAGGDRLRFLQRNRETAGGLERPFRGAVPPALEFRFTGKNFRRQHPGELHRGQLAARGVLQRHADHSRRIFGR